MEDMDPRMRRRARSLLRTLELRTWVIAVERLASALPGSDGRTRDAHALETGALLVSGLGRDTAASRDVVIAELERLGAEFRRLVRSRPRTAASSARTLREYLGRTLGYTTLRASRFDLADTALDAVVASGRGLPIALVLLYLLVGRRAGLSMAAVRLPDRMVVRVHGARSTLIDPAAHGRAMSNAECIRQLRARGHGASASSMLVEIDDRQVLLALLDDLARVYGFREDVEVLRSIRRAAGALMAG
jgi:regulator of sirC expression with transglutaminase-like and TPR domain